jgi:methylated-DNA-[protein]-cysteine S-methyltransferase
MTMIHEQHVLCPLGALRLVAEGEALIAVHLPRQEAAAVASKDGDGHGDGHGDGDRRDGRAHPVLAAAARQLDEYFAGQREVFELPLAPRGTDFQRAVWAALRAIPHGETRSYEQVAKAIGRPTASRAVGAANGKNPIAIIVPCHRVIGADGSLTGYAGGLPVKRWLLRHERREGSVLPLFERRVGQARPPT